MPSDGIFTQLFNPFHANSPLLFYLRAQKAMIHKVEKYISRHNLLNTGDTVLVALSGGADSVALLLAMRKLGYACIAVHCNFHLRGEESNRDEAFAEALCQRIGVPHRTVHFDTAGYAKQRGISIEMAAREQRYAVFEELRAEFGATAIAVAHHRDDSAETLLLNLTRGTGIKGLCGIQPKNGNVIRPLLCVGRKDIIEYLRWRGEGYVTDSTNLTTDYTRNKIRLEIIPGLAGINPSVLESLAGTAERITEAEKVYRQAIDHGIARVKEGDVIDIKALDREVSPSALLHEILSPLGFNSAQTAEILAASRKADSGRVFRSGDWSVVKDRDKLLITAAEQHKEPEELPVEGVIETPFGTLRISSGEFNGTLPKERSIATLDRSRLKFPLTLRHTRPGDRFSPFGMRGTKLVSDYLTDRKKSIIVKQRQFVITDATGTIVWLVGERPAAPCCINRETKEIVILEWKERTS